jgi:ParB family protein of integrating conjugative element (PFGI_1 class)
MRTACERGAAALMARKHPSSEQIQALLQESHFGASRELPEANPITVTQLVVEIDRILPYDRNPRRERNPLYDDIKESVRAQGGLNNPLTVTRRPDDTYYMVESGGNTRLQILKELWQETHDERFHRIHCLFRPWVSEAHVLTAHLIENDKRGDLIFIDKALAIRELRGIIEQGAGRPLSLRELAAELQARGYGVNPGLLSRMDYAIDVLLPLIPEALRSGLGRPQIDRIRRLESACRGYWCERADNDVSRFDVLFGNILSEQDGPDWSLDTVQRQLEARLAEAFGVSIKHVRLEIDARLASGPSGPEAQPAVVEARPDTDPNEQQIAGPSARNGADQEPALPPACSSKAHETPGPDVRPDAEAPSSSTEARITPPSEATNDHADIESLRDRARALASRIAERHALADCLRQTSDLGMGFLLDLPKTPLVPLRGQPDALDRLSRQWAWWLLLSLSEEVVHPDRLQQTPAGMALRDLILHKKDERVLAVVGEPDWKALGYEVLSNPAFEGRTVDDLLELARVCRRIRKVAHDDGGLKLWHRARGHPDG